jgi:hypothetical protein
MVPASSHPYLADGVDRAVLGGRHLVERLPQLVRIVRRGVENPEGWMRTKAKGSPYTHTSCGRAGHGTYLRYEGTRGSFWTQSVTATALPVVGIARPGLSAAPGAPSFSSAMVPPYRLRASRWLSAGHAGQRKG